MDFSSCGLIVPVPVLPTMPIAGEPGAKCVIATNEFDHFFRHSFRPKFTGEEPVVAVDAHRPGLLDHHQPTMKRALVPTSQSVDPDECV